MQHCKCPIINPQLIALQLQARSRVHLEFGTRRWSRARRPCARGSTAIGPSGTSYNHTAAASGEFRRAGTTGALVETANRRGGILSTRMRSANAFLVADVRHFASISISEILTAVYTFLVTILLSPRGSWAHFLGDCRHPSDWH